MPTFAVPFHRDRSHTIYNDVIRGTASDHFDGLQQPQRIGALDGMEHIRQQAEVSEVSTISIPNNRRAGGCRCSRTAMNQVN